jgi:translation elongation factor EF-Ts
MIIVNKLIFGVITMSIYILTVTNIEEEDSFFLPFSTEEKAINFINNNFEYDKPRKVSNDLFEGKMNSYIIDSQMIDQERI